MEIKHELTWWDTADTALPILLNMIPGAGFILSSIYSTVRGTHKEVRFKELLISIQADMAKNQQRVNDNFVNKEDFSDLFEETTRKIVNERTELKRIGYKNILITGITGSAPTYGDMENNLRMLDQLNESHLLLLNLFRDPTSVFTAQNVKYKDVLVGTLGSVFQQIFPHWKIEFLQDQLADLSALRLVKDITNDLQTMRGGITPDSFKILTARGKRFIDFVMKD